MDTDSQSTVISVHSPLIQYSTEGNYYTSYAVSLKSTNPCFTHSYSQIRRRYSDFVHLRRLLTAHHTTVKSPELPPKNYFQRFSDALIEERKAGLQDFLEKVLLVPVYLSDKSLHLFLQSSCSMRQVDEQCMGDVPQPQTIDWNECLSDASSTASTESGPKVNSRKASPVPEVIDEQQSRTTSPLPKFDSHPCDIPQRPRGSQTSKSYPMTNPRRTFHRGALAKKSASLDSSQPCSIPRRQGSLESSPASSVSSADAGDFLDARRVSFNENVTVATVYNHLWNIGVKPIRTDL